MQAYKPPGDLWLPPHNTDWAHTNRVVDTLFAPVHQVMGSNQHVDLLLRRDTSVSSDNDTTLLFQRLAHAGTVTAEHGAVVGTRDLRYSEVPEAYEALRAHGLIPQATLCWKFWCRSGSTPTTVDYPPNWEKLLSFALYPPRAILTIEELAKATLAKATYNQFPPQTLRWELVYAETELPNWYKCSPEHTQLRAMGCNLGPYDSPSGTITIYFMQPTFLTSYEIRHP